MSTGQVIARLEALLARVRSRAAEPRIKRPAVAASEHPSIVDEHEADEEPTRPPPPNTDVDLVVEVDGREPRHVVVSAPVEEVAAEKAFESRERLVAAEPAAPEEPSAPEESAPEELAIGAHAEMAAATPAPVTIEAGSASAPEVEAVIEEASIDEAVVEEAPLVEEGPASSRRPVAPEPEERIAQIAFGADEPRAPLHTPPPESGRLPAAAVADFDPDVTGVRDAAPFPAVPLRTAEEEPSPLAAEEAPAEEAVPLAEEAPVEELAAAEAAVPESGRARSAAPPPELVAEATRARLQPSDAVAEIVGEAQRFAPPTFVALLDASLAL